MKKLTVLFFLLPFFFSAAAQHENDTWYVVDYGGGIKFAGGSSVYINSGIAHISATISDPATGTPILYVADSTSGKINILNKNLQVIPSTLVNDGRRTQAIIVPYPGSSTKFYIFCTHAYALVDLSLNGGRGLVVEERTDLRFGYYQNVVKHAYTNSYWVVAVADWQSSRAHGNEIYAFNITTKGIDTVPVINIINPRTSTRIAAYISFSNDGKKLVLGYEDDTIPASYHVFDFDKSCGLLTHAVQLKWPPGDLNRFCFSPGNDKIYAGCTALHNFSVVQFSGTDYSNADTVAGSVGRTIWGMSLGNDNKIYVLVDLSVDAIEFPDSLVQGCGYKVDYFGVSRLVGKGFGNFINDRSVPGINPGNPGIAIKMSDKLCADDSSYFDILPPLIPDKARWNFGDTSSADSVSTALRPAHLYPGPGKYMVSVLWHKCGDSAYQTFDVEVNPVKILSLGPDTSFCFNDSITLSTGFSGPKFTWSTGSTDTSITVKNTGRYWVTAQSGRCTIGDTVNVKQIPPVLVELGGDYGICDDEHELVKLDAGKGYSHYLWTPTGDTTQWIIVNKVGDYFVIVDDYTGCKGNDGTHVFRKCNFTFYMPTSFTPNGDGLNDVFAPVFSDIYNFNIEIFDRWGGRVFSSNDPAVGWDGTVKGKPAPDGAYMWQLGFKGFQNRLLRNYNYNGSVQLLR